MQQTLEWRAEGVCSAAQVADAGFVATGFGDDSELFAGVLRRYGPVLRAIAARILRDPEEARDAIQDALLSAHVGMARFEGGSKLSTWLHRIVVNASLMRLRKARRSPSRPCLEIEVDTLAAGSGLFGKAPISSGGRPEVELERSELRRILLDYVERLPEIYRRVLWLRDVEQLDTEETAEQLGVTPNTVKIRLHRARRSLRARLAPLVEAGVL